ncbi:MAG: tetratricopeptide repeat protein [Terriglobales bacterium]|jgi:Flp pilus assembly protein TadD
MFSRYVLSAAMIGGLFLQNAEAGDLRIPVPKRATTTPVQELNREGVEAINKHHVDKAKKLFYRAYLLDPDDPFTLNNLGYISELEGSTDRALRFYALSREQSYSAVVDRASKSGLRGKTVAQAEVMLDRDMQVNRANLEAMQLLQKDQVLDAEEQLQRALTVDPNNPFTLNNLGLLREKEGDLQGALSSYRAASSRNSKEPAIVTPDRALRGHPITEVSERNAERIKRRLPEQDRIENKTARLSFLGVLAVNRNDFGSARQYFNEAAALDSEDGFVLNNMGYLSEIDGDRETADMYYEKARTAERAGARVTAATRRDVLGMKLEHLAQDSDQKVNSVIDSEKEAKRRHQGPIQLKRRDETPVIEPDPATSAQ